MIDCPRIELGHLVMPLNGLWTGKKPPFKTVAVIRNTNFSKDCRLKMDDVAMIEVEERQFAPRKLQVGDIIIEKSGGSDKQPVGRPVLFDISEGDYSFSNFTGTLRINDTSKVLPTYLQKYLYYFYLLGKTAEMQSKTTGLRNLDFKAYLRILIPIPSIEEQQRIVDELDLLSGIIDNKNSQLRDLDALAQSIFYEMFGDPVTNEKGWPTAKMKDVAPQKGFSGEIPEKKGGFWLLNLDMVESQTGDILEKKLFAKADIGNSTTSFSDDNVLYSKLRPYLNKVVLPDEPGYCTSELIPLAPVPNALNRYFLIYLLRSKFFVDYISGRVAGAKMPRVNMSDFRAFDVILPPLKMQQKFANRMKDIQEEKRIIKDSLKDIETLLASRMDYYFNE